MVALIAPSPKASLTLFPSMCCQIGPRMTLQLIKIQEGVGNGNVLFHSFGEGQGEAIP